MAAAIGTPGRERRPSRVAIRCTGAVLLLTTGGWALAALAREVPPPAHQLAAHRADVPAPRAGNTADAEAAMLPVRSTQLSPG